MLDIGWPELMVVAIVLIVVVGPKDLPKMLRTFGKTTTKMRSMATDFRRQFDDALKEAELDDVKSVVDSARKLDPTAEVRKQLNPLNKIGDEIKSSLNSATKPDKPASEPATTVAPATPSSEAKSTGKKKPAAKPAAAAKSSAKAKVATKPASTAKPKASAPKRPAQKTATRKLAASKSGARKQIAKKPATGKAS